MALRHVISDSSEWARFSRSPCTTSFLRWSSHALLWSAFIADLIFVLRVVIELVPKVSKNRIDKYLVKAGYT